MPSNFQLLCDKCQSPDALDTIREQVQEATGSQSFIKRLFGKLMSTASIVDMLSKLTDKQIHDLGGVEAVKKLVGDLYDTYIAPIDLPWVPNLLEATVVDPFLRSMVVRVVDEIHDQVHGGS